MRPADAKATNYTHYRGDRIRFRRLTMSDADMQIVDDHPADPLDFSLTRYYDQFVAGYTKNTPNAAMVSFVPDFNRLSRPLAPPGTQPAPGGVSGRP